MSVDPLRGLPDVGQVAPASILAAGATSRGGWIEPKVFPIVLAKVNTSGTSRPTATVAAVIDNPTARMICGFSIGFEPATPQNFSNHNLAVWSATALRRGRRDSKLHAIFTNRNLPDLWEVSSSVRQILIEATLAIPQTAAPAPIEGEWILEVSFEPAQPMCDSEAAAIYSLCGAKQTTTAAGPLAP